MSRWTSAACGDFDELLPFAPTAHVVTVGEGQTLLQQADAVAAYRQAEPRPAAICSTKGMNPSGSFKDNGMSAAFTHAHMIGAKRAACASTGNTSASLAMYCAVTRLMKAIIFIGSGKIAYGKLSQALDYGALTVQIGGDFDDAMQRVKEVSRDLGIYLVNSVNPFRLEGQKTIMYRVLGGAALGSARLDRRARRQPGQLQRLRQGFQRTARAGPDRPHAAAGGHQRRRGRYAVRTVRTAQAALERRPAPNWQMACHYYDELDARKPQGVDDRQRDRDQSSGQPEQVPAGA